MIRVAVFDAKPYDKTWFEALRPADMALTYYEMKLDAQTARLAEGMDAVVPFVNDRLDEPTINMLAAAGVRLIALRCAGYNHVDFHAAYQKINVVRVPGYSPHAVAEHALTLALCLNRKLHRAYERTREHNFQLSGLAGVDLYGKVAGVVGTGKIGRAFVPLCKGLGMKVLAYDPYPAEGLDVEYVPIERLLSESDVVSLHCPLTAETHHLLDDARIRRMKRAALLVNTSRGALVDSRALLSALQENRIRGAGLDVYEEESAFFFEDYSENVLHDDVLSLLISLPNVIVTSHQAFLTEEALRDIAEITYQNLRAFFEGKPLDNEICYYCQSGQRNPACHHQQTGRCF